MTDNLYPFPGHEKRPLSAQQIQILTMALDPARTSSRRQGNSNLTYMEAWEVRRTLNRIFGFGGWAEQIVLGKVLKMEQDVPKGGSNGGTTAWRVTADTHTRLYIHQLATFFDGQAVSSQSGNVPGDVADFAMKTSASDALKRAAVNLGTQFGLSLYASKGNNVELNDVVGAAWLLPVGQRAIDVEAARVAQAYADMMMEKQRITQVAALESFYSSKNAPVPDQKVQAPPSEQVQPERPPEGVDQAVDPEAMQAAQQQVAGAFGG